MTSSNNRVFLYTVCVIFLLLSGWNISNSQTTVDYQSQVATGSSSTIPVGYGYQDLSVYTAKDLVWVFYSNGSEAVYRTKLAEEGGSWTDSYVIFNEEQGSGFNVTFDGEYFHFIHEVNGNLKYMRGRALNDGLIDFDDEVVAYSNDVWDVSTRHFAIEIDHRGKPWIIVQVDDGTNFKPVLFSSIATDGSWENRPGFPKDLAAATSSGSGVHGRALSIREIDNGVILTVWRARVPEIDVSAKAWTTNPGDPDGGGTLGDLENTLLISLHSARNSIVVPQDGIALVNNETQVSRRNTNGSWELVSPGGMVSSDYNSMSGYNGAVRLWDLSDGKIRYRETTNNGGSWGPLTTKWSDPNFRQFNASQPKGSHGDHHSVLWATGTGGTFEPPFNVYMGIEGTVPLPAGPKLVSPANNERAVSINPNFIWDASLVAASYHLQLSTIQNFSTTIVDEPEITDTSYSVSDLDINTVFYWRVRVKTVSGTVGDWSDVWTFTTLGIPISPVLISPADSTVNISTSPMLKWEALDDAERYHLQVSTLIDFSSTFFESDNIADSLYVVSGLDNDRTYYWRVRAINEFGTSPWSEAWMFTTQVGAPEPPVLTSPENEDTDVLTSLVITWQGSPNADHYRLLISKQSNFSSTVINVGNISDTSYSVTGLEHSTTYYWRVNATNESGTGAWSTVWSFTTIIAIPDSPTLLSPVLGDEAVSTFPVLRWDTSAWAETYRVQVARDNQFSTVVFDQSELDSTQYTFIEELDEFTRYYWRVNATNIGGTSDWSAISHFTTDQAVPDAPVLVGPEDGIGNITNATMLWNSVPTATGYRLQVSKDADFSTTTVDRDDITNTFFQATNLEKWTTYYWRVRGVSRVGQGYWSEIWSYETGDIVSVELIDNQIPTEFALGQNYPNPFNPVTTIRFALPTDVNVRLEIYNMLGQRIATLIDGEYHTAGTYQALWDARDDFGREISSGIYIYRITAGDFVETKKMTLMK